MHYGTSYHLNSSEIPVAKPSEATLPYWVFTIAPTTTWPDIEAIYGKWLIFQPRNFIDATWRKVCDAIASGRLESPEAKCTTTAEHPERPKTNDHVICVYSSYEMIDVIGMQLVHLVKMNIRFKTDEASYAGKYSHLKNGPTTMKTLYWNGGKPRMSKIRKI